MDSAAACGSLSLKDFISFSLFSIAVSLYGMSAVLSLRFMVMQFYYCITVVIHQVLRNPAVAHCPPGLCKRGKE